MSKKTIDLIYTSKPFAYLGILTAGILSIPLMAMQFQWVKPEPTNPLDQGVNWTFSDFLIMGILIFGMGSLFIGIARVTPKKYRILIGIGVLAAFLLLWTHLAVGIVDTWPLAGS